MNPNVYKLLYIVFSSILVFEIFYIVKEFTPLLESRKVGGLLNPLAEIVSDKFTFSNTTLKEVVETSLEGSTGSYGIAIKNLRTGQVYYKNEHQVFESASLYKLWVGATAYEQIQQGRLDEGTQLSQQVSILNDKFNIASEEAELTEGIVTMRVSDAIYKMITISHNYAALLLSEKVQLSNVRSFLRTNGFTESVVGTVPQTITAYDAALFFEKLYKGKLADTTHTKAMIDLLKQQELNNKLPRYLPIGTVIAHKTGELGKYSHDGGIVYTEKGDYIIVVLTESSSPKGAEERIAKISKAVYDYFTTY